MLLLASASARRTDLLDLINIKHKVVEQDFDESSIIESNPIECSKLIVKGKNQSARSLLNDNDLEYPVLTADTLVFSPDKKIYGKPKNHETNIAMLKEFSGKEHSVFTSVMISTKEKSVMRTCETKVTFCEMSEQEIKDYVYSDEGLEKAGGYGIHGPAGKFIAIINGSYTNVVGLPVHETYELIKEIQKN